jgi:sigma54-dependent transcription regulator
LLNLGVRKGSSARPNNASRPDGGTIFLDEIGELPAEMQIALLRLLQEREFERIGGTERLKVDVRVLAATNRDLQCAVSAGTFRPDRFYRLNVFPIHVPALRERADDIPLLVEYLIDRYGQNAGKTFKEIGKALANYFSRMTGRETSASGRTWSSARSCLATGRYSRSMRPAEAAVRAGIQCAGRAPRELKGWRTRIDRGSVAAEPRTDLRWQRRGAQAGKSATDA